MRWPNRTATDEESYHGGVPVSTEDDGFKTELTEFATSRAMPAAVLTLTAAFLLACDNPLDVTSDPNTIDASEQIGLQEAINGATVDLYFAYDEKISWGGLFGDEFVNSGTAPAIQRFDQRMVPTDHGEGAGRGRGLGGGNYIPLQRAVRNAAVLRQRIQDGDFEEIPSGGEDSAEFARLSTFEGFAKTWLADLYCTLAFDGTGPEASSSEAYAQAEQAFSDALSAADIEDDIRQAALVGRARIRLIQGDDSGARSDAQQVDPEFEFFARYSTNSFEQRNRIQVHVWDVSNWSVAPAFRGLTIDDTGEPDPRVDLADNPVPAFEPSQELFAPNKVSSPSAPLRIASGDEAQYIIAEIDGGVAAVDIINEVRARHGISEEWEPSGNDPNEIRDKLIDERRRTLFLDGVRMGDLRRYLDKFSLDFFPTSTPQGFPMGDQTCWPLPDIERDNNPDL